MEYKKMKILKAKSAIPKAKEIKWLRDFKKEETRLHVRLEDYPEAIAKKMRKKRQLLNKYERTQDMKYLDEATEISIEGIRQFFVPTDMVL